MKKKGPLVGRAIGIAMGAFEPKLKFQGQPAVLMKSAVPKGCAIGIRPSNSTSANVEHLTAVMGSTASWRQVRLRQSMQSVPVALDEHEFLENLETCDVAHNCDPNADCVFERDELGGGYKCRCRQGFTGDGLRCTPLEGRKLRKLKCQSNIISDSSEYH